MTQSLEEQDNLFEIDPAWKEEWKGMPEYVQERTEFHCIKVSFISKEDMKRFSRLIGQRVSLKTKIIYYPAKVTESAKGKTYVDEP